MVDDNDDKLTQERYKQEQLRKESGLKEEYGAELTPPIPWKSPTVSLLEKRSEIEGLAGANPYGEEEAEGVKPSYAGYMALLAAIVSLFVWPAVLGPAAVILGVYAWLKGSKALGAWSVVIGLVAVSAYVIFIPMLYA